MLASWKHPLKNNSKCHKFNADFKCSFLINLEIWVLCIVLLDIETKKKPYTSHFNCLQSQNLLYFGVSLLFISSRLLFFSSYKRNQVSWRGSIVISSYCFFMNFVTLQTTVEGTLTPATLIHQCVFWQMYCIMSLNLNFIRISFEKSVERSVYHIGNISYICEQNDNYWY